MPILLTNSITYDPGRGGTVETYAQAEIIAYAGIRKPTDDASLDLTVQYGNTVDGVWVAGRIPVRHTHIADSPAELGTDSSGDYVETRARGTQLTGWADSTYPTSTNNLMRVESLDACYTHLITVEGYAGTITQ